ncbi:MAG: metallophosphoesterase [Terrimicrobiaceae bacterium]
MRPEDAPGSTDYRQLAARMGYGPLRRRLKKQAGLWAKEVHQGVGFFYMERFLAVDRLVAMALKLCGLSGRGLRNYLDVRVVSNEVALAGLPPGFDGFRILQLSDLHCDLHPPLIDVVISRLQGLQYDAAVLTGDYHNKIAESHDQSLALMERLLANLSDPRVGILGNHDFIEKVAFLEVAGLRILINEAIEWKRGGDSLWVVGVDDPHYFQSEDLVRARSGVPNGAPSILLSHSPETYKEAERLGFLFMLSGHTHGGQFCLPGRIPILRNTRVPRRYLIGPWKYRNLTAYVSPGTGGCGVAARFFCPPEITIHTLRSGG